MACAAAAFVGLHQPGWRGTNWSEEVDFAPADFWQPAHSSDTETDGLSSLVFAVIEAGKANQKIHAVGSGWAFEDAAASDGAMISLRRLNRRLEYVLDSPALTPERRTAQDDPKSPRVLVHVEAGIRIADLNELLAGLGLAMRTLGGSNGQALAGAISTSTHGGDWDQPPFPDYVRAIHLVGEDGKERWIEPSDERRVTGSDAELLKVLPCGETEIIRDDDVFDAAVVACGRFGIAYSFVLEVRRAFRVVETVHTPQRDDVLTLLRRGVDQGTLFGPLWGLLNPLPRPNGLSDATGTPYFLQILFNSQDPEDVWVTRRWETTEPDNIPDDRVVGAGQDIDGLIEAASIPVVDIALDTAAVIAGGIPVVGPALALYITLDLKQEFHFDVMHARRLGDFVSAALRVLWKLPVASDAIPELNGIVVGTRFNDPIANGRRGPHYVMTSGTRDDSDSDSLKSASIELVFDATRPGYLDFLGEVLPAGRGFRQAGYVSLRPSRASRALISMHGFTGSHAMSIEIASLAGLPDNDAWMAYVQRRALAHGGRPHWGQYNKLDALDVAMLYSTRLEAWREALLRISGTSTRFSNAFTQARGLEPESIAREVTATAKDHGTITHLCNRSAFWSPVPVDQAIAEIEARTIRYFVRDGDAITAIRVVDGAHGKYLRSLPDHTSQDNLDSLPDC